MPVNNDTLNKNLYDTLRSRGYDPIPLDSKGDANHEVEKADVFRFTIKDGKESINAWATIEGNELVLYTDDKFNKTKDFEPFTRYMKSWAQRKLLGFNISNKDHLISDMQKRSVMKKKENLGEGYYPLGKKSSYNDSVPQVKILLQHTRQLEEGEQRFRNVAKIFVENANGERFLLPTNRPGLARVYARHIAEGGTPYDEKGKHITSLVEEYTKMAGFVRATRKGQFNESALKLVNEGLRHYNDLRMTLQSMAGHRGYTKYFESYTPVLNEETDDETSLNELFVQETLDPRIESVMPILKRLSKNITEMSEVNELAEWAETITEVEDETTKTLAEPAEEMLDELSGDLLNRASQAAKEKERDFKIYAYNLDKGFDSDDYRDGDRELSKQFKAASNLERRRAEKMAGHKSKMDHIRMRKKWAGQLPAKLKNDPDALEKYLPAHVQEAPGAETLKHNQDTEKSNLKAFDLEEGFSPSEEVADQIVDSLGGETNLNSDDVYRAIEEYQSMMDSPYKLDMEEVAQIVMDRLNIADEVEEGLDANQKRVGQLGPTEPVGKNEKNLRGKLVGASESVELDTLKTLSGIK